MHFFRSLSDDELLQIVSGMERREYDPEQQILKKGAEADGMYIILQGEVHLSSNLTDAPISSAREGDVLDLIGSYFQLPWQKSAIAARPTSILYCDQDQLDALLEIYPALDESLKYVAESERLAQKVEFPWIPPEETIRVIARKDRNLLWQALGIPGFLFIAGVILGYWGLAQSDGLLSWIGGGLLLVGAALGIWRWIDWGNDFFIVTDRRAVWLEKVVGLYDSRQEAPLHMVLSISVSTDFLGRSLGYGDVVIRTYTGQLTFQNVSAPRVMAGILEEQWRRLQRQQERDEHQSLVDAIRDQLHVEGSADEQYLDPPRALLEETSSTDKIGLDHWTFQVRFEEDGIITYRKHWAVLFRFTALPSILTLLLVGLLGARLGGIIEWGSTGPFLTILLILLIPAFLWWIYQYVDWANDIYQVTPDHIVDVYKKPLAREERKIAPLENILGTEVKRKGILGVMLNYGDVVASVGTEQFVFEGVWNPMETQQDIVRAQEALLERRRQLEKRQRRNEMVELFQIYHEQTSPPPTKEREENGPETPSK